MRLLEKIASQFGFSKAKPASKRMFAAAKIDRLTSDWKTTITSVDQEIFRDLTKLRARSRQLANDNDYVKKFLGLCKTNVVGPTGICLQSQAKDPNGKLDKAAIQLIEEAFSRWAKMGNCDVTGKLSWTDLQELVIETTARDGECLVRKVKNYPNAFRFALQVLEADQLDVNLNKDLGNGSYIRMGIEFNPWGRPVAYHILTKHPGDLTLYAPGNQKYERVLASDVIHVFDPLRPGQSRGIPWMHAAMTRLNMLGGYEEAELVAARIGAAKMGFFTRQPDANGANYEGDQDEWGNPIMEAEPGSFETLPVGMDFKTFDPTHPSGNFGPFIKSVLRGISSGLGVTYNGLANDLEGVNFSSIRAGVLEERDQWMMLQRWLIEAFCEPVFSDWLDMALLTQQLRLPYSKFEKFLAVTWQGRRWQWVDPEKDMQASLLALKMGIKSVEDVIRETGRDPNDVLEAIAKSKENLKKLGLTEIFDFIYNQGMSPNADREKNSVPNPAP